MGKREKKPIVGYYLDGEIYCLGCFQRVYPRLLESCKARGLDAPEFERIREGNLMKRGLTWSTCSGVVDGQDCMNFVETGLEE